MGGKGRGKRGGQKGEENKGREKNKREGREKWDPTKWGRGELMLWHRHTMQELRIRSVGWSMEQVYSAAWLVLVWTCLGHAAGGRSSRFPV